jgi:TPR repeat protein
MGQPVNQPCPRDAWRVAALTMMNRQDLSATLQGGNAADWVQAAALCGIAQAQLRLGRMLLEGEGMTRDAHAAFACFLCAAEQDNTEGHNMLGRCFENGWGTARDFTAAAHHYRIAAEAGLDWAQYNLGHMLLSGVGVARDPAQAFEFYSRAAAQGHVRAMSLLGRCHEQGWGVTCDPAAARHWYRRSAEGGYFRGAYNYADMIAAEGCTTGALHWFERALATAPEPTRGVMIKALSSRPEMALRALAAQAAGCVGAANPA